MYPEICRIGPFAVYSYGLMLALAFLLSSSLACILAKKHNINPDTIFNLTFLSFIGGIVGARIFFIVENLPYYLKNPIEIIMLSRGGLSWFGGLILGSITAVLYLKNKKLAVYEILDLLAPFVALAQSIGRIGCFLNGCCYGRPSQYGLYFPVHKEVLIPTQLYSSLALLLIFIVLRFLQDKPHRRGQIFFAYLFFYSIKRFLIEFWRDDNPAIFLGLTLFQYLSLIAFCFAVIKLFPLKNK